MGIEYLSQAEVAQLTARLGACESCHDVAMRRDELPAAPTMNAIAVDPDDVAHVGDLATGQLACGLDGSLWRWVVEPRRDQLEQGR